MNITAADLPPGWQPTRALCRQEDWFLQPETVARIREIMVPGYGPGQAEAVVNTALRNPGVHVAFDTSRGHGGGDTWTRRAGEEQ
jgi:hypothetical protein